MKRVVILLVSVLVALVGSFELDRDLSIVHGTTGATTSNEAASLHPVKPSIFAPMAVNRQPAGRAAPFVQSRFKRLSRVEIPAKRSRFSQTFRTPEGFEAETFTRPINFEDKHGRWQPIDNALVANPKTGYRNRSNSYIAELPADSKSPVRFSAADGTIEFAHVGATGIGHASGDTDSFDAILPGVNLIYTAEADSLKERIVIDDARSPRSFSPKH